LDRNGRPLVSGEEGSAEREKEEREREKNRVESPSKL
jgi:hypothetical protein